MQNVYVLVPHLIPGFVEDIYVTVLQDVNKNKLTIIIDNIYVYIHVCWARNISVCER
jgi:hypothetical protein